MALIIASNPLAGLTNNYLKNISFDLSNTVTRIASGLRINHASDDPAGFAVAESMRANIASYSQGERNLEDAISLVQTASGSLDIIDEQLVLMKELAEEAASSTYSSEQRIIMQSEFSSLGSEIDRIANATTFNGIKLLDGSLKATSTMANSSGWLEANSGLKIHFGPTANRNADYYYISMPHINSSKLFSNSIPSISTVTLAQTALTKIDSAIVKSAGFTSYLGGLQNRLNATLESVTSQKDSLQYAESAISNADMAEEVTTLLSQLVQQEFAISMSAQANVYPQLALKLLSFD